MPTEQKKKQWKAIRKKEQMRDRVIMVPTMTVIGWLLIWMALEIVAGVREIPFNWTALWFFSFIAVGIIVLYPIYVLCRFMLEKRAEKKKSNLEKAEGFHQGAEKDRE